MQPKSIEQIMEEYADNCMAVLQGFALGKYGEVIISKEIQDEFRLILKEHSQSLLLEAERQFLERETKHTDECSHFEGVCKVDNGSLGYNHAIADCKQVLRNMIGDK